jgi:pilus assembly protein Flp/PilA
LRPHLAVHGSEGIKMKRRLSLPVRLLREERGATAVEYGLIGALIAAIIVGTVLLLGRQINTAFQSVVTQLAG